MPLQKVKNNKPRIILFQGSPRKIDSCANQKSKSERILEHLVQKWSHLAEFDVIDLGISDIRVQPCKGCVSTANGMHCHWKCVAEDQRVHTHTGFKKIKDLEVGEILQEGNKVLKKVKTSNSEDIFELKLQDGRSVELTTEHKIKVLSNERYRTLQTNWKFYREEKWIELRNLQAGDLIPTIDLDFNFRNFETN